MTLLFRAGQIDQVDDRGGAGLLFTVTSDLGKLKGHDGVRTGGGLVHGGARDGTVTIALVNLPLNLLVVATGLLRGTINPNLVGSLTNLEPFSLFAVTQQIEDSFHVNLHHLNRQLERYLRVRVRIYTLENLCASRRNDTFICTIAEETV